MENQMICGMKATEQDGSYPRPQLMRDKWVDLCGDWRFKVDDAGEGLDGKWYDIWPEHDRSIRVPFPPESELSGVHENGYHPVVWYQTTITAEQLERAGFSGKNRVILHFNAVDYQTDVWVNGEHAGCHQGGHTPFRFDITRYCHRSEPNTLTVRASDNPLDVTQPRGKQDWKEQPHVIWYPRTTGIWQTVWLETVSATRIESVHWKVDIPNAVISATVETDTASDDIGRELTIMLQHDTDTLGKASTVLQGPECTLTIPVERLKNGQGYEDDLLWNVNHPVLIDALITYADDHVHSYLGIRTAQATRKRFLVNDRPCYLRSVLEQGYWPQSLLSAPSAEALRKEVEIIKSLGFNTARIHQKLADPRFLFWADKLGLMVWGEFPAAYEFSNKAVKRLTAEWMEAVYRDFSHPSIVAWVPFNESWGVQQISHDVKQQEYVRGIIALTKAVDDTRPVIGNDGWEQVDSDITTIHDYDNDPTLLKQRYDDSNALAEMIQTIGPAGRQLIIQPGSSDAPVMLTEFGGISFNPNHTEGEWGYTTTVSAEEYEKTLNGMFDALHHACRILSGFCYTQLTDTFQEANGLLYADRTPKLPVGTIRKIIEG